MAGGANGVMTTVFRTGDRFTAHQEGNLVMNVTGTVGDGKATTKTINAGWACAVRSTRASIRCPNSIAIR